MTARSCHLGAWGVALAATMALAPGRARAGPGPASAPACTPGPLLPADPRTQRFDPTVKEDLQALLEDAVQTGQTAAAAAVVLHRGRVVYGGGAGGAGPDSLFDVASLTKVVATAPAVMRLVEQGRLALAGRVSRHLPWLATTDKSAITTEQLLRHISGLPSVVRAGRPDDGRAQILRRIRRVRMTAPPGIQYQYSDTGFIVLGELVAAVARSPLDELVEKEIFTPLRMCSTTFNPPEREHRRLLSPWPDGGNAGKVYDPLAARLGGVAGHAGLFSTAGDMARFGQMMLQGGRLGDRRVLTARTVQAMIRPVRLPEEQGNGASRGLAWDVSSPHARSRGRLSARAFGHTGFTGTSLFVDPEHQLVLVLLTNRTRLDPPPSVSALRQRLHDLVLGALLHRPATPVLTGLDVLAAEGYGPLRGRRVGLITNRAALDRNGRWIGELLLEAPGVSVRALFVPEHGLDADQDRHIADGRLLHKGREIPVHSLFGPRRRPEGAALAGLDTLVFDLPVVGVRFYTYLATMGWAMEEAARRKVRFVVLDRPDPLGGEKVQGPVSAPWPRTSTNIHPLPVRYGMTVGEVARMLDGERRIGAHLQVVRVRGWRRGEPFWRQGLPWSNPSPNIRSFRQALLYPATGLLEGTNLAVGRGTDSPFQVVGAPWADGRALARELNRQHLPGLYFVPTTFVPASSQYRGQSCSGVRLLLEDPDRLQPVQAGVALALALVRLHALSWNTERLPRLLRHEGTARAILGGRSLQQISALWIPGLARFQKVRQKYLIYR